MAKTQRETTEPTSGGVFRVYTVIRPYRHTLVTPHFEVQPDGSRHEKHHTDPNRHGSGSAGSVLDLESGQKVRLEESEAQPYVESGHLIEGSGDNAIALAEAAAREEAAGL